MNSNVLNAFQEIVHTGSLVLLGFVLLLVASAAIKPGLFRGLLQEFSQRKYILSAGLFASLLCGTVFIATQPGKNDTYVSENTKQTIAAVDPLKPPSAAKAEGIKIEDVDVTEPIEFTKEEQQDANLAAGETKLLQAGKNGKISRVFTITYKDGKETSRVLKSETIIEQSVPEITAIGTNSGQKQPGKKNNSKPRKNSIPWAELKCRKHEDSRDSRFRLCLYRR